MTNRLVGVYDADGGLLGEAAYIWGKLRGTRHCALCDITHSPLRRKPAWDAMVARLGVPFELLHLNELSPELADAVQTSGAPVILVEDSSGLQVLFTGDELDTLGGSIDALEAALGQRLGSR